MATEGHAEILEYIATTKHAILTYVREDLTPVSRTMGSFGPDGSDLFFSTRKEAAKVQEITHHKRVSFFFEHDNQLPGAWKSVLLIGDAEVVADRESYQKAVELLSAKSPRFRERAAAGDLSDTAIYRVITREIEYVDRGKGGAAQKIIIR